MSRRRIALLGPQRQQPILVDVLRQLGVDGRCAAITAGWQERELEVGNLDAHLGRPVKNLNLYQRSDEIFLHHPELRETLRERKQRLDEVQQLYQLRIAGMLDAARELLHHPGDPALLGPQRREAIDLIRVVDRQHLARLSRIRASYEARLNWDNHPAVQAHREQLRHELLECSALLIAGGHVLVLLNRLRLFGISELAEGLPIIAWSAGAMCMAEWIVLFHHHPPQGHNDTQVAAPGLALAPGIVPFPHATRRLWLNSPPRVALLARRFAPWVCATLDPGGWVEWTEAGWQGHGSARRLGEDGNLHEVVL